jgi:D-sedoheptulose 7-phosphate isomerase
MPITTTVDPKTTSWSGYARDLTSLFAQLSVTLPSGAELGPDEGFRRWHRSTMRARAKGGSVFLVGNGASASMASHFAADIAKNARVRAQVFTDPALLTAVANDVSFEEVFAEPVRWNMRAGDLLIAISSSGNSPNVLRAVKEANRLGGETVTLSAMEPGNALRRAGRLNFHLPAPTYGLAETAHAALLHFWVDQARHGAARMGTRA